MRSLLRSTAVRLAFGYAVLFIVSSLLLAGFLWWRTALYLDREIDAVIIADGQAIADRLRDFGLPGAVDTINERVGRANDQRAIYLLTDPTLTPLAGNLQAWPLAVRSAPGWYQINLVRDGNLHVTRVAFFQLPGGYRLLVGRDVEDRVEARQLIVSALGWSSLGALILAIVGGSLVRGAVLRRVEAINRTASAIVLGDLSHRVPTRGSSDEFDRLARTINTMLEQIEHLIEGVRNATNVVAHDLRTPLAELRTRLETLISTRPPLAETYNELHDAVADIDRIVNIFNALLRLAEIDSGVRRSGFRRVELADVTTELLELYEPLAEEKHVALMVDAPEGIAVRGDPDLLAQAIGNLVDNAIKYTPCGGTVALRIASDVKDQVSIALTDTGPGIADADRARVTERFYRGNRTSGTEGIGLGLSVVDAVVRLHGGSLAFSDNGPGLAVILTLPRDAV
ncbi:MAG: ATP-binding protein [Acetobacteraceae bacterium]|jgi:signal transduction histidine kinase